MIMNVRIVGTVGARAVLLLLCVGSLTFGGCGLWGKGVKVSGKVVLPQDAKILPTDDLHVDLTAIDNPRTETGKIDHADLTFTINGADQKGVPPGKYKVKVTCRPYPSQDAKAFKERKARLDQQFGTENGDANGLPIVEIEPGADVSLTIDLRNKTVTK
jgi:hypothetical protein